MQIILEVTHVTVVTGHGADKIFMRVNRKEGIYPFSGSVIVEFECATGTYAKYLKETFPEITEVRVIGKGSEEHIEKLT
jgi:hypothetical protein